VILRSLDALTAFLDGSLVTGLLGGESRRDRRGDAEAGWLYDARPSVSHRIANHPLHLEHSRSLPNIVERCRSGLNSLKSCKISIHTVDDVVSRCIRTASDSSSHSCNNRLRHWRHMTGNGDPEQFSCFVNDLQCLRLLSRC